jgi:calcium-dependent protein kinase
MGTSYYIAPEVLREDYDERCDVWSIGVLLYILLSGKAPFDGATDEEIINNIVKGEYQMTEPIWSEISSDATKLIGKMLTLDYKKRIFAKDALKDRWFKNAPKQ